MSDRSLLGWAGAEHARGLQPFARPRRVTRLPMPRARGAPEPEPLEEAPLAPEEAPWISVQLSDDRRGIAREKYRIELPDGTVREEELDGNGFVRIDDISRGICKISFPEIHLNPRDGPDWPPYP